MAAMLAVGPTVHERVALAVKNLRDYVPSSLVQTWLISKAGQGEGGAQAEALTCRRSPFALGDGAADELASFRHYSTSFTFGVEPEQPEDLGLIGRTYIAGEPRCLAEVQSARETEYRRLEVARQCGVHCALCVPLHLEGERSPPIGVLEIVRLEPQKHNSVTDLMSAVVHALKTARLRVSPSDTVPEGTAQAVSAAPGSVAPAAGKDGAPATPVANGAPSENGAAVSGVSQLHSLGDLEFSELMYDVNGILGGLSPAVGKATPDASHATPDLFQVSSGGVVPTAAPQLGAAGLPAQTLAPPGRPMQQQQQHAAAMDGTAQGRERVANIPLDTLAAHFCYNLEDAARRLGVCRTKLKQVCRTYGIARWPKRTIQKYQRHAERAQTSGAADALPTAPTIMAVQAMTAEQVAVAPAAPGADGSSSGEESTVPAGRNGATMEEGTVRGGNGVQQLLKVGNGVVMTGAPLDQSVQLSTLPGYVMPATSAGDVQMRASASASQFAPAMFSAGAGDFMTMSIDETQGYKRGRSCHGLEAALNAMNDVDGTMGDSQEGASAGQKRGRSCHGLEAALTALHGGNPAVSGAPAAIAMPLMSLGGRSQQGQVPNAMIYTQSFVPPAAEVPSYCHACGKKLAGENPTYCTLCGVRQ